MAERDTPWKPSHPAMKSHDRSISCPSCVKLTCGRSESMAAGRTAATSVSTMALRRSAAARQVLLDAGLTVGHELFAEMLRNVNEVAVPSRPDDPHAVVQNVRGGPCVRRGHWHEITPRCPVPARRHGLATSTCARLRFSNTTLAMPWRCNNSDKSSPAGPPPMMATWVLTEFPLEGAEIRLDFRRKPASRCVTAVAAVGHPE